MSEQRDRPLPDRIAADYPIFREYEDLSTESSDPFSCWLDNRLDEMEERYREFWTQQSLIAVLIDYCYGRP